MSGIVGSSHNIRGSGVVAKLGTDGQVFTSAGAGVSQTFEAAAGGGKIGQVLQAVKNDTFGSYTTAAFGDVTDLTIAITPVATSSKVLIVVSICHGQANDQQGCFHIAKGGSALVDATGDADGDRKRSTLPAHNPQASSAYTMWNGSMTYLDSPNTTSATTYNVQVYAGSTGGLYVNRTYEDSDTDDASRAISTITVMEILA